MRYKTRIKHCFDKLFALIIIIVFSPLLILLLLIVWISQGGALFYVQYRSGLGMKGFKLYKVRTLQPVDFSDLSLLERNYTRLGKWLRATGLDEIPQLYNVLRGEMSFVGPRPMPIEYDNKYNSFQKKRFDCLPGITGWAQIKGRNNISWKKRFELDNYYVSNISFLLDFRILFLTISHFIVKKNHTEMPVFTGSKMS